MNGAIYDATNGGYAPDPRGDILFHIRAKRIDLCFELGKQIMSRLDGAVAVADDDAERSSIREALGTTKR